MTDATTRSPLWLVFRVFDEPHAVFVELAHSPRALLPLLLFVTVSAGIAALVPSTVLRTAAEIQFRAIEQRRPGAIPAEVRERAVAQAGTARNRIGLFIAATLGGIVMAAVTSGALMMIFGAMSGGRIAFRDEWAIAWHAYVPQVLGLVITWVGIALTNDMQFRVGLGFLVSPETSVFGHSFAQQFTIFGAWNTYLLALGNQVKTGAKGIGGSLAIVGILWVLANALFAALSLLGSGR